MMNWITFKLQGMVFKLKCWGYSKEVGWIKTSFRFNFKDIIYYKRDGEELFTPECVDLLVEYLDNLIDEKMKKTKILSFFEPDFEFVFHPRHDTKVENGPCCEDISLDLHVRLWDGGLTDNYFSTTFEREDIVRLRDYLVVVTRGN